MQRIKIVTISVLALSCVLMIFAGFALQRQQNTLRRASPTPAVFPTFTNTPSVLPAQITPTFAQSLPPTATPVPPTATPRPPTVIVNTNINVRNGPGTNYGVIGGARAGQNFPIIGIESAARKWIQINYNGIIGWVYAPLVTSINTAGVQVAAYIPPPPVPTNTPTPVIVQPTSTPIPTRPTRVVRNDSWTRDNRRENCISERERRLQERRDAEKIFHERRVEDIRIRYARMIKDAEARVGHSFAQFNQEKGRIDRLYQRDIEDEQLRYQRRLEDIDRTAVVCD